MKKFKHGFTLAEVLITLGIIGVVAALTLPAVIQNHRKITVETRLKKFYSMMNQAIKMSEIDNGDVSSWTHAAAIKTEEGKNDYAATSLNTEIFFLKYIAPYIKYLSYEHGENTEGKEHFNVYLPDSSIMKIYGGGCMDIYYDVNGIQNPNVYGRDRFAFGICFSDSHRKNYLGAPKINFGPYQYTPTYGTTRAGRLEECEAIPGYCASLIMFDGWKISDDYPYKL